MWRDLSSHHRLWVWAIICLDDADHSLWMEVLRDKAQPLCASVPLQRWHHSSAALSPRMDTDMHAEAHTHTHISIIYDCSLLRSPHPPTHGVMDLSSCGQQQLACVLARVCVGVCEAPVQITHRDQPRSELSRLRQSHHIHHWGNVSAGGWEAH